MRRSSFQKIDAKNAGVDVMLSRDIVSQYDKIAAVSDKIDEVVAVADSAGNVATVAANIGAVTAIGTHIDAIIEINDNVADVHTVADNIVNVNQVASNIDNINNVVNEVIPNIAEILQADDRAATATNMAVTATAQAALASTARVAAEVAQGVAETKASEANLSAVAADTSADLATIEAGTATTQAGIATAQAVIASTKASEAAVSADEAEAARDAVLGMEVATGAAGTQVSWDGTTLTVPQGVQGIQGIKGDKGDKGDTGEGLTLKGTDTAANIVAIVGAAEGDFWIASDTGDGYVWIDTEWKSTGQIRGPQGVQGTQGPVGPQGEQGLQGIQGIQGVQGIQGEVGPQGIQGVKGDTGDTGPQGLQGVQGPQGETGPQGLKGDTGAALTIRGTDTAAKIQLKTPTLGDFWVASDTGDGYAGDGSSWVNTGLIRGPQGLQGVQGEVGPKGDTGDTGPQGIQGVQGIQGLPGEVTAQQLADGLATKAAAIHNHDGSYYTESEIDAMLAGLNPLPTQTGQTGKYLTTNGTDASWAEVQSGSEHYDQEATPTSPTVGATWYKPSTGKIYTRVSDGATETWLDSGTANTGVTQTYVEDAIDAIDALPVQTGNSGKFLKTDGATAIWESIPPAVVVNTPSITSPTTGATDFLGTITSSAYGTVDNYKGTHDYSNWQLSYTSDFAVIQQESTVGNLTSWTPSVGLALQTCYVRVRYGSDNHLSEWSTAISFTTPNIYVQVPTMTVTGTPTDVPEQPTLTTSAFAVFNGTDTHVSTDWVITQGGTEIWSSMGDTTNKTSIVVPAGELVVNTAYVFKARHNGTTYGSSGWVEVNGTTKTAFSAAYGVEWNQTTDTYTRTGLAAGTANSTSYAGSLQTGMRRCVLNANGTVNYYLHPTDSTKKADGSAAVIDGTAGNVMVEIPKFYYKYEYAAPVHKWSISPIQEAGYTIHPAFVRGGVEKNYRYYCAYEGYNNGGTLKSRSGVLPTASQTIATFRTQAQANGAGWSLIDWNLLYAVQMLFLTEYADFDTQAMIGNGNDTGSDYAITTGQSNAIGNASSPATNDDMWMSYRGIENWYASMHKFIDGVNVSERVVYVNGNPATFASDVFTGDYISTGASFPSADGYVNGLNNSSKGFIANAATGTDSTYIPDYIISNTGTRIVLFGGDAGDGLRCGGFWVAAGTTASGSAAGIGSGVAF